MEVARTAPKVREVGRPRGRHIACAAKMPVGDPEPTPMRQSPEVN